MKRLLRGVFIFAVVVSSTVHAQVLTEWVETRTSSDTTIIALGYPLPIPDWHYL